MSTAAPLADRRVENKNKYIYIHTLVWTRQNIVAELCRHRDQEMDAMGKIGMEDVPGWKDRPIKWLADVFRWQKRPVRSLRGLERRSNAILAGWVGL